MAHIGIGSRVKVIAGPAEGTDRLFNGKEGTVIGVGKWISVKLDGRQKPDTICRHNLVLAPSPSTEDKTP